ncbi:zinc transporter ZIP3-like [Cylas formicarius]|uniref:zinc transporter ZIP3-like n=1 Tax=Cylas formicarius TaxID=197179 RepID=UPI002958BD2B|nr:zinc transporter ZIP3-like [Cylas formicarius]
MNLINTKVVVALLLGFIRFFFGILPVKLYRVLRRWEDATLDSNTFVNKRRHDQLNCWVMLCQSFGGGVLFATCFLHMMKQLFLSVEEFKVIRNVQTEYPLSQLAISVGFFCIYFLEEWSHWLIERKVNSECTKKAIDKIASNLSKPLEGCVKIAPVEDTKRPASETRKNSGVSLIDSGLNSATSRSTRVGSTKSARSVVSEKEDAEKVTNREKIMRCVLTIAALSLHSIIEGLSIGLQRRAVEIWYLFTAVSIHSATILFCLGLELLLARTRIRFIVIQMGVLALATPFGMLLGLIVTIETPGETTAKSIVTILLEGLSAGAILYITFFEILNREKERRVHRMLRGLCIVGGFAMMGLLQQIETMYAVTQVVVLERNRTRT